MTSILISDRKILFLNGTYTEEKFNIESFHAEDTALSVSDIVNEAGNQVKIENIIKETLENTGMTTEKVVILLPDSLATYKPIIGESGINKSGLEKILTLELSAAYGENFSEESQSHYLLPEIGRSGGDNQVNNLAISIPVAAVKFTERLASFLKPSDTSVITEGLGLINFVSASFDLPENILLLNFINNNICEVIVRHHNDFHSLFKINAGSGMADMDKLADNLIALSEVLSYKFPDDIFYGSCLSSSSGTPDNESALMNKLNLEFFDLTQILSNITIGNVTDMNTLTAYLSLLGTLV